MSQTDQQPSNTTTTTTDNIQPPQSTGETNTTTTTTQVPEGETPPPTQTPPTGEAPNKTENPDEPPELTPVGNQPKKQSRSEKKAKKSILKLGLKAVPDVFRVTIKKGKDLLFVISEPEVYKNSGDNTYIIFGEAKIDEIGKKDWEGMAQEFAEEGGTQENADEPPPLVEEVPSNTPEGTTPSTQTPSTTTETPQQPPPSDEKTEDGVPSKYVDLVLEQIKVPREKAIKVLKETELLNIQSTSANDPNTQMI